MAKKKILTSHTGSPFILFGISCHMIDYRFIYTLNKELGSDFSRQDDFQLTLPGSGDAATFPFYSFRDEEQNNSFFLLANRNQDSTLIPEFKQADFIFIIGESIKRQQKELILKRLRKVPKVILVFPIPLPELKNHLTFLHEIEFHVMKTSRG